MSTREDVSRSYDETFAKAVQGHLDKLLITEFFCSSPRSQTLLRTIVRESLAGRAEALKEIVLAKEVFGRSDYDPKRHTLVRVEVAALRRKLTEYYSEAGREDHIRISIPPGHYIALFSSSPAKPVASHWRWSWYVIASVITIGVLSSVVILSGRRGKPIAPTPIPLQVTFDTGWTAQPAVSRNGSVLVYASDRGPRGDAGIWIQQAGKPPRQLTDGPAHDITPDISPDGKQIVFRSWRKDEGIWSISAEGKHARLLARGGYAPRFSPDGRTVAFARSAGDELGHVFTVPAAGGATEQVDYGTEEAHCPVWSADGSKIVFVAEDPKRGEYDLWTTKAAGTPGELPRPLGVQAKLRALNVPVISSYNDCPQDWIDDRLLFVTHQHDTSFLFEAYLQPSGALGQIRAVPASIGATGARFVRRPGGRLSIVFAPERRQTHIWGYDLSSARLQQLTHDNSLTPGWNGTWPALSGDGNILAFLTERTGSPDICVKDLRTGFEQLLAAHPAAKSPLFLDANGGRIVFVRNRGVAASIVLRTIADKTDRVVATDCPVLQDWSSDNEFLLCADHSDLFEVPLSESSRKLVLHLTREPELARLSPDSRWVAFVSTTGEGETIAGYVAPLDGSNRTVQIDQEVYTLSLHWAREGSAIYYWSLRDGFRCLYMQRLDAQSKVPQGDAVAVLHRHDLQRYPWSGATLAAGSGRLVMTLTDQLANVWELAVPRSQE